MLGEDADHACVYRVGVVDNLHQFVAAILGHIAVQPDHRPAAKRGYLDAGLFRHPLHRVQLLWAGIDADLVARFLLQPAAIDLHRCQTDFARRRKEFG